MTDEQRIATWTTRLRRETPNVVAILLKGSHAQGTPGPYSDLDFDVLVDRDPYEDYLAWFEEDATGRLHHISVAVQDLVGWMAEAREPVSWSLGLPAAESTRLLWARDSMLCTQLDVPARMHPAEEPELEDFIEAWGKIRNARLRDDDLAMRLAAQTLGSLAPTLLQYLNPKVPTASRYQAMQVILAFPVAPEGYRNDIERCLGISGKATSMTDLYDAAERLTFGIITLLREHADVFEGILPHDLYTYLVDGTLDRYIRQTLRSEVG
jgi:predicted nucleotidyltransferase